MAQTPETRSIQNIEELENILSEPTEAIIHAMGEAEGRPGRSGNRREDGAYSGSHGEKSIGTGRSNSGVIGVSRFSATSKLEELLDSWGVETHRGDLLDAKSYARLPDAPNVVFMAGMKFGSTGQESLTWAMNAFVPGLVGERYRDSRIAIFSTGNVYGLSPVSRGGSVEGDALHPQGEYALSCLGRERIFEHFSRANQTKMSIIRLNYAVEVRYGVLLDIAQKVFSGQAVPLAMGHLNAIWQADAAAMSLQSLSFASTPPFVINVTGPEVLSVARIAGQFGELFHKPVRFEGSESEDALLNNAGKAFQLFGLPRAGIDQILNWIAEWVARGGETLEKPTHFENRRGDF